MVESLHGYNVKSLRCGTLQRDAQKRPVFRLVSGYSGLFQANSGGAGRPIKQAKCIMDNSLRNAAWGHAAYKIEAVGRFGMGMWFDKKFFIKSCLFIGSLGRIFCPGPAGRLGGFEGMVDFLLLCRNHF